MCNTHVLNTLFLAIINSISSESLKMNVKRRTEDKMDRPIKKDIEMKTGSGGIANSRLISMEVTYK